MSNPNSTLSPQYSTLIWPRDIWEPAKPQPSWGRIYEIRKRRNDIFEALIETFEYDHYNKILLIILDPHQSTGMKYHHDEITELFVYLGNPLQLPLSSATGSGKFLYRYSANDIPEPPTEKEIIEQELNLAIRDSFFTVERSGKGKWHELKSDLDQPQMFIIAKELRR